MQPSLRENNGPNSWSGVRAKRAVNSAATLSMASRAMDHSTLYASNGRRAEKYCRLTGLIVQRHPRALHPSSQIVLSEVCLDLIGAAPHPLDQQRARQGEAPVTCTARRPRSRAAMCPRTTLPPAAAIHCRVLPRQAPRSRPWARANQWCEELAARWQCGVTCCVKYSAPMLNHSTARVLSSIQRRKLVTSSGSKTDPQLVN